MNDIKIRVSTIDGGGAADAQTVHDIGYSVGYVICTKVNGKEKFGIKKMTKRDFIGMRWCFEPRAATWFDSPEKAKEEIDYEHNAIHSSRKMYVREVKVGKPME